MHPYRLAIRLWPYAISVSCTSPAECYTPYIDCHDLTFPLAFAPFSPPGASILFPYPVALSGSAKVLLLFAQFQPPLFLRTVSHTAGFDYTHR